MNNLEVILVLLLLFMAVPDVFRKLRRAALGSLAPYPVAMLLAWPEYCEAPGVATWLLLKELSDKRKESYGQR